MSRTLKGRFESDVNVERIKEILENLIKESKWKKQFSQ